MSVYSKNKLNKTKPNEAWTKIFGFIEPGSDILDVGCSSGKLGAALKQEKKVHIIGLDIDKDDVELAKKNLDDALVLNIETDDVSRLGSFDVIIMADVIEHLVNPVAALEKLKPLLKPDGILVFSIPNMANATIRLELLKGRFEYKQWGLLDKTHLHFYDRQEVERVFKEAGYGVIKTDCTIRNIPVDIMEKELEALGVIVTAKFVEFLNSAEALTYQFIGYAVPSKTPKGFKLDTTSPLDSISREIDQINEAHGHEIQERDKRIAELQLIIQNKESELRQIYDSKAWKLVTKARKIRNRTFPSPRPKK